MIFGGNILKKKSKVDIQAKLEELNQLFYAEDGNDETDLQSFNLAKEILQADPNCDEAAYILGLCYFQGAGTNEDADIARKIFLDLVNKGYEGAYRLLGDIAWNSTDENERKLSFKYYSRCLESYPDNEQLQLYIAECYAKGIGTTKDTDKAFEMFNSLSFSAISDTGDFQYRYADFLENEMKSEECLIWYKKAYEQGDAFCAYKCGTILAESDLMDTIDRNDRLHLSEFYLKEAIRLGEGTEVEKIAKNQFNIYISKLKSREI